MVIFPSTLLGILPVGCLLYMHGTLSAETFLAVIVLSFGVIQPLITAFSYTDGIAQVTTIVGEVAKVLSGEDMQRPERAEKLPADNSIELKNVALPITIRRRCTESICTLPRGRSTPLWNLPATESPPLPGLSPPCGM